jgi:hypothetical protein
MIPEDFDLERELRQALRPVEPSRDFSARFAPRRAVRFWRRPRGVLAIAASLIVALLIPIGASRYRERQRRGEQARDQLLTALRITGSKLQKTRQQVVRQLNRRDSI